MRTDYLILGQGLCGTWLSYYLLAAGASVLVVDEGASVSASSLASGIINHITGKRLARQWLGDTILPFAAAAYAEIGSTLGVKLAGETSIHTFFSGAEEATFFEAKAAAADDLLHYGNRVAGAEHFNYHYGIGTIHPALLVDVRALLRGWREQLISRAALVEARFDWADCTLNGAGIRWNGIEAKAVIDCSGAASASTLR